MAKINQMRIPNNLQASVDNWRDRQPVALSLEEAIWRLVGIGLVADSAPSSGSQAAINPQSVTMPPWSNAQLPTPSSPYRWQDKKLAEGQPKQVNFECPLPVFAKFQFCLNQVASMHPGMKQGGFLVHIVEEYTDRILKALGIPINPPD
jgi:hypothetical protein